MVVENLVATRIFRSLAEIKEEFQAMKSEIDRRVFLTAALGGILAAPAIIPNRSYAFQRAFEFTAIRETIKKAVGAGSPASFAVAVAKGGKVIWEEAFGWADTTRRVPATLKTRYAVSSVSKPFTATAIMTQVERGLLDIEKPLGKHIETFDLKAFAGDAAAITPRHLLQHTSGLPRHWRNLYSDEKYSVSAFTETVRRYGIITEQPGDEYQYSNLGYGLLARIAEQISGMSFAEFLEKEVFLPLGLKNTTLENGARISRPAATLYNADGSPVAYYTVDECGSQRVFSTVSDLIRFGMFHLKNSRQNQRNIIGSDSISQMRDDKQSVDGGDLFSGLGWLVRENGPYNHFQVAHSGDAPGVSAQLMLLPDENIAIAVLSNTRFAELIYTVTDEVLDMLLPDNKKMRESDPALKANPAPPPFVPTSELLGVWKGEVITYSGNIPALMTFKKDGDVHVKLDGQLETKVSNIQVAGDKLSGRCHGTITTEDAMSRPHQLRLALKRERDTISGTVHAQSSIDSVAKGFPKRDYFALASWIKLTKSEIVQLP